MSCGWKRGVKNREHKSFVTIIFFLIWKVVGGRKTIFCSISSLSSFESLFLVNNAQNNKEILTEFKEKKQQNKCYLFFMPSLLCYIVCPDYVTNVYKESNSNFELKQNSYFKKYLLVSWKYLKLVECFYEESLWKLLLLLYYYYYLKLFTIFKLFKMNVLPSLRTAVALDARTDNTTQLVTTTWHTHKHKHKHILN